MNRALSLCSTLLFAGCVTTLPTQPSLLSLPGTNKSLDEFNADDGGCRQYAAGRSAVPADGDWTTAQRAYDYAYIQCMYVKGHKVPVAGQFTSAPAAGAPPPPPGTPAPAPK